MYKIELLYFDQLDLIEKLQGKLLYEIDAKRTNTIKELILEVNKIVKIKDLYEYSMDILIDLLKHDYFIDDLRIFYINNSQLLFKTDYKEREEFIYRVNTEVIPYWIYEKRKDYRFYFLGYWSNE